jgi:NDP-sugar pyrophosphorylase family protein
MSTVHAGRTAVLLAGGLGSRLRPYTLTIPKPLLPLGDSPIIKVVVRQLASQGFTDIVVSTGYLGELIEAYLRDGEQFGVAIRYYRESEPLGTAGALSRIEHLPDSFLVMNGDILTTLSYADLVNAVDDGAHEAAVATTTREVRIDYGVLHTSNGVLDRYEEKPRLEYEVSMGIYALRREALRHIPQGRFDMPDLLQAVVDSGGQVRCLQSTDYWRDVGRLDDFELAAEDFLTDPDRFVKRRS